MKVRALKKRRQEMNGWPITRTWRDRGEWVLTTALDVVFHRYTGARISFVTFPRACWRRA